MGYSDQKYYSRPQIPVITQGTATTTASGTNTNSTGFINQSLPKFFRQTDIRSIRIYVTTVPATNLTNVNFIFLNGTNTFATATIGTNTAGSIVDATVTAGSNTFTLGGQPVLLLQGTSTASGMNYGTYDVDFEQREVYSTP